MKLHEAISLLEASGKEVVIWGEAHFKIDEVDRIRKEVIAFDPDVILHELWFEDAQWFSDKTDAPVIPLEKEVGGFDSQEDQFISRERSMLSRLSRTFNNPSYDKIAVVIGDTHLRTIDTPELGKKSPINQWASRRGAKIVRSNYKEIA